MATRRSRHGRRRLLLLFIWASSIITRPNTTHFFPNPTSPWPNTAFEKQERIEKKNERTILTADFGRPFRHWWAKRHEKAGKSENMDTNYDEKHGKEWGRWDVKLNNKICGVLHTRTPSQIYIHVSLRSCNTILALAADEQRRDRIRGTRKETRL